MDLYLYAEEEAVLRQVVLMALSNLRDEVYKTENYEWRQALQRDEVILKTLIARLDDVGVASG